MAVGLLFRLVPWGLPLWAHHFGGGALWGAMIYCLVAAARPRRWTSVTCLLVALAIVVAVETSRLVHTPALDAFRLTLAGQILLGRIFSIWNLPVDALGVAVAAAATRRPSTLQRH